MNRDPVKSSNVVSVGYDAKERVLEIEFRGGAVYLYHDVPRETHNALMHADSIGSFVHRHIKEQFKFTRPKKEEDGG